MKWYFLLLDLELGTKWFWSSWNAKCPYLWWQGAEGTRSVYWVTDTVLHKCGIEIQMRVLSFPEPPDRLEAHSASYWMATGASGGGARGKTAWAWTWPYLTIWYRVWEWVEAYLYCLVWLHGVYRNIGFLEPKNIPHVLRSKTYRYPCVQALRCEGHTGASMNFNSAADEWKRSARRVVHSILWLARGFMQDTREVDRDVAGSRQYVVWL